MALTSVSELITHQLLSKNPQTGCALQFIFQKHFLKMIEYFSAYGGKHGLIHHKQAFLKSLYALTTSTEESNLPKPTFEFRLQRYRPFPHYFNSFDCLSYGWGRDYLIDT